MAFDFPSSPTVGQQFTPVAGVTYTWNGYGWDGGSGAVLPGTPVVIQRIDLTAGQATADFTSGIDATYDEYELHLINVQVTANGPTGLRISQDGGATWKAGATDYSFGGRYITLTTTGTASLDTGSTGASFISFTGGTGTNQSAASSNTSMNGRVKFWQPAKTVMRKSFLFDTVFQNPTDGMTQYRAAGTYVTDNNPFNGLRLLVSGTTFAAGSVVLYGIKK
jgi:hypothetical protein